MQYAILYHFRSQSLGYPGISVYLSIQKIAVPTESDVAVVTLGTGSAGILAAQLLKLKCKTVFAISDSAASLKWIEKEVKDVIPIHLTGSRRPNLLLEAIFWIMVYYLSLLSIS
mmetsp:Transcript_20871/g.33619  ORF Transcript_20871/g.33619 Transcript_20871/m.33619 type:complete len:114 (+) Transcript_20871:1653-1994(+)